MYIPLARIREVCVYFNPTKLFALCLKYINKATWLRGKRKQLPTNTTSCEYCWQTATQEDMDIDIKNTDCDWRMVFMISAKVMVYEM